MIMDMRFGGGKKVEAELNGFVHKTDQPEDHGGENTAPEPVDYFFASIGLCTAYTVLGFCQSRGLPTEGIRVTARLEKDESGRRVARIRHEIRLPEGFPEKYEKAIVRAADMCTVKRYLNDPPAVETVTVKS
ncbi:MAG: OsmC family protein [Candidatus Eisenbacteria bacterium]